MIFLKVRMRKQNIKIIFIPLTTILAGFLAVGAYWFFPDQPPIEVEERWSAYVEGYRSNGIHTLGTANSSGSSYWSLIKGRRTFGAGFSHQRSGWRIHGSNIGGWQNGEESVEIFLRENIRRKVAFGAWDDHISIPKSSFTFEIVERKSDQSFTTIVRKDFSSLEVIWEKPSDPYSRIKKTSLWASLHCAPSGFASVVLEGVKISRTYLTSIYCGEGITDLQARNDAVGKAHIDALNQRMKRQLDAITQGEQRGGE